METCFCFFSCVAVAVLSVTLVNSLPLPQKYSKRLEQEEYFKKYGYYNDCLEASHSEDENEAYGRFEGDALEPGQFADGNEEVDADSGKPVDPEDERFSRVVICFQRKFGLQQTGVVDEATREMVELQENDLSEDLLTRRKRFVKTGMWNKAVVTYYIKNYDVNRSKTSITAQVIRSEIQAAIKMWTDASNLNVSELNSTSADIVIGFYPDDHGDQRFKSGSLAHTFKPGGEGLSGDMHLKADVAFTAFTSDGVNLRYVVTHEFGHAIGFGHSNEPGAVMNPVRRGYDPNLKLGEDDIKGVQSLYGAPAHHEPATDLPTSQPVNQSTNQPACQPANQPTNQPANQPTSQPTS